MLRLGIFNLHLFSAAEHHLSIDPDAEYGCSLLHSGSDPAFRSYARLTCPLLNQQSQLTTSLLHDFRVPSFQAADLLFGPVFAGDHEGCALETR